MPTSPAAAPPEVKAGPLTPDEIGPLADDLGIEADRMVFDLLQGNLGEEIARNIAADVNALVRVKVTDVLSDLFGAEVAR